MIGVLALRTHSRGRGRLATVASLALLALLPAAAGAATAPGAVANFFFSPATVTVYAGDTVQWTNTQGFHDVSVDSVDAATAGSSYTLDSTVN